MDWILRLHHHACLALTRFLLRIALGIDDHRRGLPRRVRRWYGSLRRMRQQWLVRNGLAPPPRFQRRFRPWNRTSDYQEELVVRLHVEQPHLGAGQLRRLAARVLGFEAARETFRQILIRRQDLVAVLQEERRRTPRRIRVSGKGHLWGADLTLIFVLGFLPVWILAVVDYQGSRLLTFQPMVWPSATAIARSMEQAFFLHGAPRRVLTDRGPVFRSEVVERILVTHGVVHTLTFPAHPWTNGRCERLFRTFKEMVRNHFWLIASHAQLGRICSDFLVFYNRDRPHSSFGGRTPNEVYFGLPMQRRPLGRVTFFEGRLVWYRFG